MEGRGGGLIGDSFPVISKGTEQNHERFEYVISRIVMLVGADDPLERLN